MPHADVNGQRLFYEDTGDGDDVIIFSHGFFMNHSMFDPQVEALSDTWRCVAWDERGHGQTETSPDPFTYWDSASDLFGLLDHLGVQRAVLAGMSQGGFLSMRAALTAPERVRALVLIDTQPGAEDPEQLESYDQLNAAWTAPGGPPPEVVATVASLILGPDVADTERWMGPAAALPPATMNQIYDTLRNRDDISDRMGELTMPALVIHGTDDFSITIDIARAYVKDLPDAELVEIQGAAHAANLTHPDQVNPPLEAFLARL
jgi:pimeloyl-ACP methyl ester carboxylesterase